MSTRTLDPSDRPDTTARRWAAVCALPGLALLTLAGWAARATAQDRHPGSLAGVGYLLALLIAVPGGLAFLLSLAALALARRAPESAITCAVVGALVGGGTLAMVLATYVSG